MRKALLSALLVMTSAVSAWAAEIIVFCPGAVQTVVRDLSQQYERQSGNTIKFEFGTAGAIAKQVAGGAQGDVVITTASLQQELAAAGKVESASIRDLGAMGVGLAVRNGTPKPDIHDVAAFKSAMLSARSITFADPAKGGQSGIHIAKVFAQLGLDKELAPKLKLRDRGPEGLKDVAAGTTEVGLGQISEILANKDVTLVGPLPPEIQSQVMFSASRHSAAKDRNAAADFVRFLTTPASQERFKQAGFVVK